MQNTLLTPGFVNTTSSLVDEAGNLLASSELRSIVNSLVPLLPEFQSLLKPGTFHELQALLTNVSDLLTDKFVQETSNIISGADSLLTPPLISALKDLLDDVVPLMPELKPVLKPATISS